METVCTGRLLPLNAGNLSTNLLGIEGKPVWLAFVEQEIECVASGG